MITDTYEGALDYVLSLNPDGTALEFGVGSGGSLRRIAKVMPVIGFDSFQGLPEDWRPKFPKGRFKTDPPEVPNAHLVIGLFEDTVPSFEWPEDIGLVHIDCDLYSSTKTVLAHVPLVPGTFVVFDEYHGYPGFQDHEYKAWLEYVVETGTEFEVVATGPEQLALRILA